MIKYLKYEEIDRERWDYCIGNSVNKIVYAYSWYLDIVCDDWGALVEDDYIRVMPLNHGRKFLVPYIFQPYFTQQLGVFSRNLLSPDNITEFLEHIPPKFLYGELNLNSYNVISGEQEWKKMLNHELDMIRPYEILRQDFSKNTKRNINKAEKNGLRVVNNLQPETLVSLFQMNKGKEFKHISDDHYKRLTRLMHTLLHKNEGETYACLSPENEVIASAFFIRKDGRLIFFFSALSESGKELGAMFFLIDSFIRNYSETIYTLDFEGSNNPDLARFYKSWGAQETYYPRIEFNNMPGILKAVHSRYQKWKQGRNN